MNSHSSSWICAGGVVAGLTAAAIRSIIYGGATRGVFSVIQSAGATLAWVPVSIAGGAVTAAVSASR